MLAAQRLVCNQYFRGEARAATPVFGRPVPGAALGPSIGSSNMDEQVLYVDDDPNWLGMYKIQLEQWFRVTTAQGGAEGLEILSQHRFAVVISDLHMPGMDGIEFLSKVHETYPDIVRLMLTAKADLHSAVAAVNRGKIFRLLIKPCASADLKEALEDAVLQFRLVRSERELLSRTLSGAVKLLTEVLATINPDAFGRVASVRHLVREMCRELKPPEAWQIEIAAMLSNMGYIGLPHRILARMSKQLPLSSSDMKALESHPKIGAGLLSNIPRLEGVARIVEYQQQNFAASSGAGSDLFGERIPIGARILKVALEYDALIGSGVTRDAALAVLQRRDGIYDPAAVGALCKVTSLADAPAECPIAVGGDPLLQDSLSEAVYFRG